MGEGRSVFSITIGKCPKNLHTNFKCPWTDCRTQPHHQLCRIRLQHTDSTGDNTGMQASPAGMHGSHLAATPITDQHRKTVRRQNYAHIPCATGPGTIRLVTDLILIRHYDSVAVHLL